MPTSTLAERRARLRQLLFLRNPRLWPHWPILPVVRRTTGGLDCGLMFDARHVCGRYGYSATVFLSNILGLPPDADDLLAFAREVYDTAEEVYAAGWRVD
jgi:hypothetical protein